MGRLVPPGWQPLSDTGAVMPLATATWSRTGTATAKNTYSNKALSSANANPVVADASGRFGAIFGLEDEGYRLVLKNAAGSTIYTLDEVFAESVAVDELLRRKELIRSPFDNGAVGDGSTDDYTALNLAMFAADGVLDLEGKTYRCDSSLTLRSGITIKNGTLDFSQASASVGLQGGGSASASVAVTTATTGGQTIVTAAIPGGLSAGELIRLRSSDVIGSGQLFAELFRVEGVTATDILTHGTILGTYTTTPRVEEITSIYDIRLENLTILAPSGGYAIDLDLCERVTLRNVRVKCTGATEGIRIRNCYGVLVDACEITNKTTSEAGGIRIGDASRDVIVRGCRIERALAAIEIGDDYGSLDGLARDIRIEGCSLVWCGGVTVYAGARYVDIVDNTILCDISPSAASTPAILVGGADVSIRGNTIRDPEGPAITVTPLVSSDSIAIVGNVFQKGETHAIHVTNTAFQVESLRVCDNEIHEPAGSYVRIDGTLLILLEICRNECRGGTGTGVAIDVNSADLIRSCSISDNATIECGTTYTHGIRAAAGTNAGDNASSLHIDGNVITADSTSAQTGILATDGTDFSRTSICGNSLQWFDVGVDFAGAYSGVCPSTVVEGNIIQVGRSPTTAGTVGIRGTNATNAVIANNTITSNGIAGVTVGISCVTDGAWGLRIVGNSVGGQSNLGIGGNGIEVTCSASSITGLVVTGNRVLTASVSATEYALLVAGAAGFELLDTTITGNTFKRADDSGPCIRIADANRITCVGNVFNNGTYGISIGTNAESIQSDNVFTGQATGDVTGTFTNSSVNTGYINLDITTIKITSGNALQATTEGMLPDTNTDPILQRINGATDKAHRLVWAATSVVEIDFAPFAYPPDLDDAAAVVVNLLISKDTNTDSGAVVAVSYFEGIGDANAGTNTGALSTAAITKYTVTIAASNIGAYPTMAKIGLTPGAHANDAIRLHAAWIEYTSKKHTA